MSSKSKNKTKRSRPARRDAKLYKEFQPQVSHRPTGVTGSAAVAVGGNVLSVGGQNTYESICCQMMAAILSNPTSHEPDVFRDEHGAMDFSEVASAAVNAADAILAASSKAIEDKQKENREKFQEFLKEAQEGKEDGSKDSPLKPDFEPEVEAAPEDEESPPEPDFPPGAEQPAEQKGGEA